ncbi:MAG: hypothetical protein QXO84_01805 [Candidatus Aenigmatarchaeota archaeon]
MKLTIFVAILLLLLSAFLFWRHYNRESKLGETIQTQSTSEIEQNIERTIENEVDQAVEGISDADIEAAILG